MKYRNNLSAVIHIVAGAYLAFLGVRLIKDGVLTGSMQGGARILGIVFGAIFIGFGGFIAVHALMFGFKSSQEPEEGAEEEIVEAEAVRESEPDEAAPAGPASLFARANMLANAAEEEETEEENEEENEPLS